MLSFSLQLGAGPRWHPRTVGFCPIFSCWINKLELWGQDLDKPRTREFGGYVEGYLSVRLGYESVKTDTVVAHSPTNHSWWDLLPRAWLGRTGQLLGTNALLAGDWQGKTSPYGAALMASSPCVPSPGFGVPGWQAVEGKITAPESTHSGCPGAGLELGSFSSSPP